MAFLDATLWNDIQPTEATNDKRFSEVGLIDGVVASTPATQQYIPPSSVEQLQTISSRRDVQFPVIKDQQVTVVQTPGFDQIPTNLIETDQYSFTAFDVFTGFRFFPAAFANNSVDAEFALREQMLNTSYAAANEIESILAAQLETRKSQILGFTTQVSQGDGTFTFNATTDTLEVSKAAQKETMFYNLEELMIANELPGPYRIVTSRAGLAVQVSESRKFGPANNNNLQALGFLPEDRIHKTGNISPGTDIFNGWFFRDGAIGVIENFPWDFRNNTMFGGKEWSISDTEMPFTKMRANIYVNNEATEATSLVTGSPNDSNLIMTHFEEMAMWWRFFVVYRYNSSISTRAQDILKIQGLTT